MKTIDDVIEQCEKIANASKQHTLHMTHFSQSYDEWAEEWTQIAEWLKELKAYKDARAEINQALYDDARGEQNDYERGRKSGIFLCESIISVKLGESSSENPNTCGDAISREAAVNAIYDLCGENVSLKENPWRDNPHMDAVVDALENLPSVTPHQRTGRWIPVSERLPEKRGDYLVTQKAIFPGHVFRRIVGYAPNLYDVDEYDFADKKRPGWYEYDSEWGYRELDDVIAWMPLPEPYKTESEEKE